MWGSRCRAPPLEACLAGAGCLWLGASFPAPLKDKRLRRSPRPWEPAPLKALPRVRVARF